MAAQKRTDIDIEHFRQRLREERVMAEQTIAGTRDADANGMNDTGTDRSELSNVDNHPADMGTDMQLREQDDALIVNAQAILKKIDDAMAKLEDGTYGISDRSGDPIPTERLEAVPYATMTAEEQSKEEVV